MFPRTLIGAVFLAVVSANASYAIRPEKAYPLTPASAQLNYDSLNIPTRDHSRLTAWYCKAPVDTSQFVIVMAGGDAGNMGYDVPLAQFIVANFRVPVLLFDYRGFGSSQDFKYDPDAIGHPEYLTDLDAAVTFTKKTYPDKKIILYGRSLGGALAIVEACRTTGLAGVIAESPYTTQRLLKARYEDTTLTSRKITIRPIASNDLEPFAEIKNFHAKNVLILHGKSERFILSSELESRMSSIPADNKKFIDFDNCDHLELPMKDPQHFGNAMAEFLSNCR